MTRVSVIEVVVFFPLRNNEFFERLGELAAGSRDRNIHAVTVRTVKPVERTVQL